jgi:hypothetical protein
MLPCAMIAFARSLCRGAGIPDAPPCLIEAVCGLPRGKRREFLDTLSESSRRNLRAMTAAGRLGLLIEQAVNESRESLHRERVRRLASEGM